MPDFSLRKQFGSRPHLWLIAMIGVIVPRRLRADWRQEWEAELWRRERLLAEWDKLDWRAKLELLRRSLSAFWDALWLQPQRWENEVIQDLRYGARMLRRNPAFTFVAVFTLALGIGANSAFFMVFGLYFRPLPIKEPETLVKLEYRGAGKSDGCAFIDYVFFRDNTQVFSDLIASSWPYPLALTERAEPQRIKGQFVSENFFSALGANMSLGRSFAPDENRSPGKDAVVVLSHSFWVHGFGGETNIIGRSIRLGGKPVVVIGVTAPDFVGLGLHQLRAPDVWLPLMMRAEMPPRDGDWFGSHKFGWLNLSGRLKPGRTYEEAGAEMALLTRQLARAYPGTDPRARILVRPLSLLGPPTGKAWQVAGVVILATMMTLLIACANLANLLLARAAVRRKEIGLRLCIGASRMRVIRQLLTESLLLAGLGGVAGLLLAWWSLRAFLAASLLSHVPLAPDVDTVTLFLNPDARVMVFTSILALLTSFAFGLFPALQSTGADLVSAIKDGGALLSQRVTRSWLRNGLLIAQVSLSLVLLVAAGLLLRGLMRAGAIDPGFETRNVLVVEPRMELTGNDPARAQAVRAELAARLADLPGVLSVSRALDLPLGGAMWTTIKLPQANQAIRSLPASYNAVAPNYFETVGIPLVRGRVFSEEEVRAQAAVVIVSESTALTLWPNQEPLGQVLQTGLATTFVQVIGVARDAQTVRLGEIPPRFLYLPLKPQEPATLLLRTSRKASEIQPLARAAANSNERIHHIRSLEDEIDGSGQVMSARTASVLATRLGLLALLLAVMGIYGVIAYSVSQRTREIGIRMALGAQIGDVVKLVIKQGMRLVFAGVFIGLVASSVTTRVMKSLLLGLSATDPATLVGVALLLIVVALIAIYVPARRATKVDPRVALRRD
ncbi:MAG TPA: ABC transporter permease [Blastocatellia bacterium]|nr:ABC transporter permease [Blastocatellia bacterium]